MESKHKYKARKLKKVILLIIAILILNTVVGVLITNSENYTLLSYKYKEGHQINHTLLSESKDSYDLYKLGSSEDKINKMKKDITEQIENDLETGNKVLLDDNYLNKLKLDLNHLNNLESNYMIPQILLFLVIFLFVIKSTIVYQIKKRKVKKIKKYSEETYINSKIYLEGLKKHYIYNFVFVLLLSFLSSKYIFFLLTLYSNGLIFGYLVIVILLMFNNYLDFTITYHQEKLMYDIFKEYQH